MNRAAYRRLLQERGCYSEPKSNGAVTTIMEMQYYVTSKIVEGMTRASGNVTAEVVSTAMEMHFTRRHLPSTEKDLPINSAAFPEVKTIHAPALADQFRYDIAPDAPPTATAVQTQAVPAEADEAAFYSKRAAPHSVTFDIANAAKEDPKLTSGIGDIAGGLLDDDEDEEEGGDRKRIRL
jgi:hypothetical protein